MRIGTFLRKHRSDNDLTQSGVSKTGKVGIMTVVKAEQGKLPVRELSLNRLAKGYGLPVTKLVSFNGVDTVSKKTSKSIRKKISRGVKRANKNKGIAVVQRYLDKEIKQLESQAKKIATRLADLKKAQELVTG